MNSNALVIMAIVLSGAAYYALYRVVFHQLLRWSMIHSIWIPIAVAVWGVVMFIRGLGIEENSAYDWITNFAALMNLMMILFPVFVFFVLYAAFDLADERKRRRKMTSNVENESP
jgi:hypothetical protein